MCYCLDEDSVKMKDITKILTEPKSDEVSLSQHFDWLIHDLKTLTGKIPKEDEYVHRILGKIKFDLERVKKSL